MHVGLRYVLAILDAVVWPNNTQYVTQCVQTLHSILNVSGNHASHLQMSVPHAQTHMKAVIKHRRFLEDQLIGAQLDVLQQLTLTFDKSTLPAGDKRPPWHPCLFVTSNLQGTAVWDTCAAVASRSIGPCPLIRVSDMLGYDPDNRPAPSARLEQSFGMCVVCVFFVLQAFGFYVRAEGCLFFYFILFHFANQCSTKKERNPSTHYDLGVLHARYTIWRR